MRQTYIQSAALILFINLMVMQTQAQQAPGAVSCARPEFQLFLPLVGNWKVQWTDRIEPGKYADTTVTARIERDPIGCMMVEHFYGKRNGRPFTVVALLSFGYAEKLQRVFIDSDHGQFLTFEGLRDGDDTRYEWQRDFGTRHQMVRHEYRAIRADSFVTETFLSTDRGKTWDVVQRAKYQRQK